MKKLGDENLNNVPATVIEMERGKHYQVFERKHRDAEESVKI